MINNIGIVTALCMDTVNGCIISGANDHVIRIYDPKKRYERVQNHCGHQDEIKAIIHIPSRNQVRIKNIKKVKKKKKKKK